MDFILPGRLLGPWDFPGKNTGVSCHFFLQGIFLIQGSNLHLQCLLHFQANSFPLSHLGNPEMSVLRAKGVSGRWAIARRIKCAKEVRTELWSSPLHRLFCSNNNCLLPELRILTDLGCMLRCSVMSDALRPEGPQPARLLCPWDSPGKNTGDLLNPGLQHCRWLLSVWAPGKPDLCWHKYDFPWLREGFPGAQMVRNLPAVQKTQVWSRSWEDPLEKGMAPHSSTLAWRIPWTEEPGYSPWGRKATNTFTLLFFTDLSWHKRDFAWLDWERGRSRVGRRDFLHS